MTWASVLLLFGFIPLARADILFLDLNNSPKEIAAAQEAAAKSNRKLIVLPSHSPAQVKQLNQLKMESTKLTKEYDKKCKSNGTPECLALSDRFNKKYNEYVEFQKTLHFDPESLRNFLRERDSTKKALTSVVVSGHDGTGTFAGVFGRVGDEELAKIFGEFPYLSGNVRSLHLWGCYTTSPGSLMLNWKRHFPNTALISGYEGRAPLNDKPAGWHYLKGVLAAEPALLETTDHEKLKKALAKIPGALQTHAAISVCDNYASNKESYNFAELEVRCRTLKQQLEEKGDAYNCYLKAATDECADPPANTGAGLVREFYEVLHKASACSQILTDPIYRTYSRDQAIRLVFAKEVQKNFARIYGQEIAEVDKMLAELGAPADVRFAGMEKMSRRDFLLRTQKLQNFIQSQWPDFERDLNSFKFGEREGKLHSLAFFQAALSGTLVNLDHCVPFEWVEPNENTPSKCVDRSRIGLAGVVSAMTDELQSKVLLRDKMLEKLNRELTALTRSEKPIPDQEARTNLLWAQINYLHRYTLSASKEKRELDPREQAAQLQLDWAELTLANSINNVVDPKKTEEAIRIARDYHEATLVDRLKYLAEVVKSLETARAGETMESAAQRMRELEDAQLGLAAGEETSKILRLLKSKDSDDLKAAAVGRRTLGERLLVLRKKDIASRISSIEKYLQQASTQSYLTNDYVNSLRGMLERLKEQETRLLTNPEAEAEKLVESNLDTIAFQEAF
jgi:hypothetical protein